MRTKWNRMARWVMLIGTGGVLLQATGCDVVLQSLQTGFLAALTGMTYYLARNI